MLEGIKDVALLGKNGKILGSRFSMMTEIGWFSVHFFSKLWQNDIQALYIYSAANCNKT